MLLPGITVTTTSSRPPGLRPPPSCSPGWPLRRVATPAYHSSIPASSHISPPACHRTATRWPLPASFPPYGVFRRIWWACPRLVSPSHRRPHHLPPGQSSVSIFLYGQHCFVLVCCVSISLSPAASCAGCRGGYCRQEWISSPSSVPGNFLHSYTVFYSSHPLAVMYPNQVGLVAVLSWRIVSHCQLVIHQFRVYRKYLNLH